ncbi:hydroxymethylbilane synthase [Paroceanicella profunda]|uniref:Porphobilinogen deaminase n=1 Tax=Paroceanicella profunda TaxID=2579971 RepID=A0A5B8FW71_9RHOB|nr:hydroxymethylbilane synthase [Paroceanicella profunda]QDL91460.1 hydroxymethylbilane synthase [Paroceanicella profunda]
MTTQCSPAEPLCIGTRGSPLALAQAEETRDRLMAAHGLPQDAFRIRVIRTTGDAVQDRSLAEIGGKGLFTKEIEEALLSREIDIAVHSMKDVATLLPEGLVIDTLLPRADVRDAFISSRHTGLEDLPQGATVGTSSLRRRAQLLAVRPDLRVVEFRGNVQTRLKKLETGVAEATFLACAGLQRLGRAGLGIPLSVETVLPAPAQGAIGIERRVDDARAQALLAPLGDAETAACVAVERAFLAALDGSCRTPIAALARVSVGGLSFRGEILRPDGTERHTAEWSGPEADAAAAARALGESLRERAGAGFFG